MAADGESLTAAGPWRITFDTNPDDCNLACVMCEEHSRWSPRRELRMAGLAPHRRMDVTLVRRVVREMAPRGLKEIIPSTMGEPLLYSGFEEIVEVCREYGVRLNLTTNGTWPRRGPVGWAELLCPVTSDVKVSWNGTSGRVQEGIMPGSSLERRSSDLCSFIAVRDRVAAESGRRCRVTLQCTFMEANLGELPDLVRFAAELGVDRVKGHHLWVHFTETAEEDLRRDAASRRRWNLAVREVRRATEDHRRPDGSKVHLENFLELPEVDNAQIPTAWSCPFLGREAWVNHAGRFDPCCAPDAERRSLGDFGSVTGSGGLSAIWTGPVYRDLERNYRDRPLCGKCTLRRPMAEGGAG